MELTWEEHFLDFIKPAKTSRGEYSQKHVIILNLKSGNKIGSGEASPLPDLSIDGAVDLLPILLQLQEMLAAQEPIDNCLQSIQQYPAIQFAFDCCLMGLNKGNGKIFDTAFTNGTVGIPINGLIWMDDIHNMEHATFDKIKAGFTCIKLKVGAQDHDSECRLLEKIRKQYSAFKIELRLDANGAYDTADVDSILNDFKRYEIHSIEQPIKAGQHDPMRDICATTPIPVALDEELIRINVTTEATKILQYIKPQYLILKPTLLGGFSICDQWIKIAKNLNLQWWATSALESNTGLGHIAQWVSSKKNTLHQGLGTGTLYKNNLPESTFLRGETMWFKQNM